jgi:tRNA-specific 2-thiouridylase
VKIKSRNKELVVVGLSGGVDSSVAAYLLKQQGYDVIGIFMKNWHDSQVTIANECPWAEDVADAKKVADNLGIDFETVDLSEQYKERVVDYMFKEYERGRTPNPDVLCNKEIKFDVFLDIAMEMGADYVATGHYSRLEEKIINGKKTYRLLAGLDHNKDQSYFLCQLSQQQLSKILFHIGELNKSEVRRIARELNLVTATKKDSQGICFVGKIKLPDFLQVYLKPKEGNIISIPPTHPIFIRDENEFSGIEEELEYHSRPYALQPDFGKTVGIHRGAHYFTNGQRKGLGVGGTREPLYIIATDISKNIIYTGEGKNHPGLYRKALSMAADEVHWIRKDLSIKSGENLRVKARIRYRQPLQDAMLYHYDNRYYLYFEQPQSAITSGQFAAWYIEDELIGSGVIS